MTKLYLGQVAPDGTVGGQGGPPLNSNVLQYSGNLPSVVRVTVSPPGAGSDWAIQLPTSISSFPYNIGNVQVAGPVYARLASGFVVFNTSGVVATRYTGLIVKTATNKILARYYQLGGGWSASLSGHLTYTRTDKFTQAGTVALGTTEGAVGMPPLIMQPGWIFGSVTGAMDPADTYSTINIWLQMWPASFVPVPNVPGPML